MRRHVVLWSPGLLLVAASYGASVVALATNSVLTRIASPEDFGAYRYVISVVGLAAVVANLGYPYSTANLLSRADGGAHPRLAAASLQLLLVCLVGSAAILALLSLALWNLLDVARLMLLGSALIWTTGLQRHFIYTLRGIGGSRQMALQTALPPAIILMMCGGVAIVGSSISVVGILTIVTVGYGATHLVTSARLKVWSQRKLGDERSALRRVQSTVGFPIYKGALVSVGVIEALVVFGGAVLGAERFGQFALALSLATPVATLPSVLGMIQFRSFANSARLGTVALRRTVGLSLSLASIAVAVGWSFFHAIFPDTFDAARSVFPILAFGMLAHGLGDYLNQFLQAQGEGHMLMTVSYIVGPATLVCGLLAIPWLGLWGLVFTRATSSVSYLVGMTCVLVRRAHS